MRRNPVPYKPVKAALQAAGITYGEVAARHGCIYRMVQFVVDGKRSSAPLMRTIQEMILERKTRSKRRAA